MTEQVERGEPKVWVIAKANGCYDDELFNDETEARECCGAGESVVGLVPQSALTAERTAREQAEAAGAVKDDELRRLRELLVEVYRQAGNSAPDFKRHALTPNLRDAIRDVLYPKQPPQPERSEP